MPAGHRTMGARGCGITGAYPCRRSGLRGSPYRVRKRPRFPHVGSPSPAKPMRCIVAEPTSPPNKSSPAYQHQRHREIECVGAAMAETQSRRMRGLASPNGFATFAAKLRFLRERALNPPALRIDLRTVLEPWLASHHEPVFFPGRQAGSISSVRMRDMLRDACREAKLVKGSGQ